MSAENERLWVCASNSYCATEYTGLVKGNVSEDIAFQVRLFLASKVVVLANKNAFQ